MNLKIICDSLPSYFLIFAELRAFMGPLQETVIATLPGHCETERLEVVLLNEPGQGSRLQLRQQSWGDGVGWFTQSSVELEPHQVAALKTTLGTLPGRAKRTAPPVHRCGSAEFSAGALRLVRADSA